MRVLSRRLILGSAITLLTGISCREAWAGSKTIDRRVRSENHNYGLTFAAEDPSDSSNYGHAFIIWQQEDDSKRMSVPDAIGFYPTSDPGNLKLIFGTNGALETDAATTSDLKLTVLLNSDLYQRALARKASWAANGTYAFLWSNCVTHVAAVASAVGLATSGGTWETPKKYVSDLIDNND
jgi:hypothetical protein